MTEKNIPNARVLIMDDEEIICKVLIKILTKEGYRADSARNGETAIKMYQQSVDEGDTFDLIIMDMTIKGGMGAVDAVKGILAINPDAKVAVSSGYSDDPVMKNFEDYGFKGVITKPYTFEQILHSITEILNRS